MTAGMSFAIASMAAAYLGVVDDGWDRSTRILFKSLAVLFLLIALLEVLV